MHVHLILVSKYRRKIFTKALLDDLKEIFQKVCFDFECEMKEMDGQGDHVHLLMNYPPKVCISKLVNSLKGVSSRKNIGLHHSQRPLFALKISLQTSRLRIRTSSCSVHNNLPYFFHAIWVIKIVNWIGIARSISKIIFNRSLGGFDSL
jgi:REP element-mobilizing transposase RayT